MATLAGVNVGVVENEEIDVSTSVISFPEPNTEVSESGSSDTEGTQLLIMLKPVRRLKASGIKRCDTAADAKSFSESLTAKCGYADGGKTHRYSGDIYQLDGIVERVLCRVSIGKPNVRWEITVVEGVSIMEVA